MLWEAGSAVVSPIRGKVFSLIKEGMVCIFQQKDPQELTAYHTAPFVGEEGLLEVPSFWFGNGANMLGLSGSVSPKEFKLLAQNLHPISSSRLTLRKTQKARVAFDITISAPKSVSVMALVLDDPRIIHAHVIAV